MEVSEYIKRLNEINTKKLALLEELTILTQTQNDFIKSDRFDEVSQLIEEKQKIMDAIDKLDEKFLVYAQRLKSALSITSLERLTDFSIIGTKKLKDLVVNINKKLGEIKTLDEENAGLVKKEFKQTGDKINHSNAFKQVNKAYNPSRPQTPSYYFDKKK